MGAKPTIYSKEIRTTDISTLTDDQLKKLITQILDRGYDYVIRNKKLFTFKIVFD